MSFMIQCWWRLSFQWRRASWLIVGAMIASSGNCAVAQITPDRTLGTEGSRLTPNVQINGAAAERIEGGAQRGGNLFHSFSEFNVGDGQRVYFVNPSGIENIVSRVTGKEASNILGTLGVEGSANLFLLNPNGIIFGKNAQLDVRGSFAGTTANAIAFGNQGIFSATNPQAPPILTVNPSALLFNQIKASAIAIQSNRGIQVPQGENLLLVGGNVTLDGGQVFAQGGRIELGGLAGNGAVELISNGNELQLNFPEGVPRADVVLQNNATVGATGGGAVAVVARNLNLFGNSFIATDLQAGEGTPGSRAGDVAINATGTVTLDGKSFITNYNSLGDTGNVEIDAQSIRLTNQSLITTDGERNRGDISLNAIEDVTLDGNSLLATFGTQDSIGDSGDITVNARNINLSNRAATISSNIGQGRAGQTILQAENAISLSGGSSISSSSAASVFGGVSSDPSGNIEIRARSLTLNDPYTIISSSSFQGGRAGDIRITTDQAIALNNFSNISSSTNGQADAGNIQLQTLRLELSNGAVIDTLTSGQGNSGDLLVNAKESVIVRGSTVVNSLTGERITQFSNLSTQSFGFGNAGQIKIDTRRLSLQSGGKISADNSGIGSSGQGGDITVRATDAIEVFGVSPDGGLSSSITSTTAGSDNAGNLILTTPRLSVRDGAFISTEALEGSTGQGGDLTVNASDLVEVVGASSDNLFNSYLSTATAGSGNAGRLTIDTRRLSIRNGAYINASTGGSGRGGDLIINAADSVEIVASPADTDFPDGLFTLTVGSGNAGDAILHTQRLSVRNGGAVAGSAGPFSTGRGGNVTINAGDWVEVVGTSNDGRLQSSLSVRSRGSGQAGNITVNTPRFTLKDRGVVVAESNTADGGNINLTLGDFLLLQRNSAISATAGVEQGAGNGGNITIDAPFIVAVPSENSDITANAFTGNGGNIQITTSGIFGTQFRESQTPQSDITASSEFGLQGGVEINNPEVDPSAGLVALPVELVDAPALVATGCSALGENEFIITGRGGLPPSPSDPLRAEAVLTNWVSLPLRAGEQGSRGAGGAGEQGSRGAGGAGEQGSRGAGGEINTDSLSFHSPSAPPASSASPAPIVEAQGWVINNKGEVVLTATATNATSHNPWMTPANCHMPEPSS